MPNFVFWPLVPLFSEVNVLYLCCILTFSSFSCLSNLSQAVLNDFYNFARLNFTETCTCTYVFFLIFVCFEFRNYDPSTVSIAELLSMYMALCPKCLLEILGNLWILVKKVMEHDHVRWATCHWGTKTFFSYLAFLTFPMDPLVFWYFLH